MSLFFFDQTDAIYNDSDLNKVAGILFGNGVFNTYRDGDNNRFTKKEWEDAGDFLVEASGGNMTITAKAGSATVLVPDSDGNEQQAIIVEDSELSAQVSANPTFPTRNDAVVLRVDQTIIDDDDLNAAKDNAVSLVVVGGSDANPLTDDEISTALGGDKFVRLANIAVPQSTSEITNSMITDARKLPEMSRAVQPAGDSFQFYALTEDPENPEAVQVWYNSTEKILKMYNGQDVVALQTQDFNWGYYPPNGTLKKTDVEYEYENDSGESITDRTFHKTDDGGGFTEMRAQLFEMPNLSTPFFRLKFGNPNNVTGSIADSVAPADVKVEIYTVDGSDEPDTLVEEFDTIAAEDMPINDYIDLYTEQNYTAGDTYIMVVSTPQGSGIDPIYFGTVQTSSLDANDFYKGTKRGTANSETDDPTAMSWGTVSTDTQFILDIGDISKQPIGETDATGNYYKFSQSFTAASQDIQSVRLLKGEDQLSPSGSITLSLYEADANNDPTGSLLSRVTVDATTWDAASDGENVEFILNYDELVVGSKYVFVVETEENDDENNYTVYFVGSTEGEGRRYTTADGWVNANGDFLFEVVATPFQKIVVTDQQGYVPDSLVKRKNARVKSYTSSATPSVNVNDYDAVVISALAESITSVTVSGTPSDFDRLRFRITASGSSRTIAWGSQFEAKGVALDTSVASGQTLSVLFEYDASTEKWGCVRSVETS